MLTLLLSTLFLADGPRQAAPASGLRGEYFRGTNFEKRVCVRYDKQIDFTWTHKTNGFFGESREYVIPAPGVPAEDFSVRWTADLIAPETGTYMFEASVDDGLRVYIGGVKVLDTWRLQQEASYTADVLLEAGKKYPLKVEYFNHQWDARVMLSWRLPSQSETEPTRPIAASQFALPTIAKPKPLMPQPIAEEPEDQPATLVQQKTEAKEEPKLLASAEVKPATKPARPARAKAATSLPTLKRGATVTLPNLYFELDSPDLMESSEPTLDALVAALEGQPDLHIQIAGHTDLSRDLARSQRLSQSRAAAIKDYLVENGIEASRVSTIGYGASRPLYKKSDARNRRVEIKVQ